MNPTRARNLAVGIIIITKEIRNFTAYYTATTPPTTQKIVESLSRMPITQKGPQ